MQEFAKYTVRPEHLFSLAEIDTYVWLSLIFFRIIMKGVFVQIYDCQTIQLCHTFNPFLRGRRQLAGFLIGKIKSFILKFKCIL